MKPNQFLVMNYYRIKYKENNPDYIYNSDKKNEYIGYKKLNSCGNYSEYCFLVELLDYEEPEKEINYITFKNSFKIIKIYHYEEMIFKLENNDNYITTFLKRHHKVISKIFLNNILKKLFSYEDLTSESIWFLTNNKLSLKHEYKIKLLNIIIKNFHGLMIFGPYNLPKNAESILFEKFSNNITNIKNLLYSELKFQKTRLKELLSKLELIDLISLMSYRKNLWENNNGKVCISVFREKFEKSLINGKLSYNNNEFYYVNECITRCFKTDFIDEKYKIEIITIYTTNVNKYIKIIQQKFLNTKENIELFHQR